MGLLTQFQIDRAEAGSPVESNVNNRARLSVQIRRLKIEPSVHGCPLHVRFSVQISQWFCSWHSPRYKVTIM